MADRCFPDAASLRVKLNAGNVKQESANHNKVNVQVDIITFFLKFILCNSVLALWQLRH